MAIPGGNPAPLGLVTVTTSGTPVPITANFANMALDGIMPGVELANKINFMPDLANGGEIFVGKKGIVIATGVGVLFKLAAGQGWSLGSAEGPNIYNVHEFWLDASVSGDKCYVSYEAG